MGYPYDVGPCRQEGCSATVYWLFNDVTNKRAPIDYDPHPRGNIIIDTDAGTYHVLHKGEHSDQPKRVNHWFTCANPPQRRLPPSHSRGGATSATPTPIASGGQS